MKALSSMYSCYFEPFKFDIIDETQDSDFIRVVRILLEFNAFIILLSSFNIPRHWLQDENSENKLLLSFMSLLLEIERMSKEEKFEGMFNEMFSVPVRHMLHLIDQWPKYGSHRDFWCYGMERQCSKYRRMVSPHPQCYLSLQYKHSFNVIHTCHSIMEFEESKFLCYRWGRSLKIKTHQKRH